MSAQSRFFFVITQIAKVRLDNQLAGYLPRSHLTQVNLGAVHAFCDYRTIDFVPVATLAFFDAI